ncbi:MAG: cell wall-binding repeat-containing protein, partial [Actinobacteria bacterium]|nr:cell wall-binding repeat-containing protein [Actinomycetota bacterium]
PVILTPSGGLTPAVKAELKRLKPGKVFFIGLPETVRPGLVDAVGGADVVTIRGKDRYETAALLAAELKKKLGTVEKIVLAPGDKFPDALSAAPLAARKGWPILLTPQAGPLPTVTSAQIQALGATSALVVGTYVKPSGIQVLSKIGADRYHTSALVAEYGKSMGLSFAHLALTTGENYPDALVAASLLVSDQGLLVLTRPIMLPSSTKTLLSGYRANMARMDFVGLPAGIVSEVKALLK